MEATTATAPGPSRWQRLRGGLTPGQWRTVAGMAALVLALHAIGFVLLFALVAPNHLSLGNAGAFTVGVGITAYTLGLRHAFDADHIGAIDNTTRKLMSDGQRPRQRRLLLLARPLDDRLPARARVHDRDQGAERRGRATTARGCTRRPG